MTRQMAITVAGELFTVPSTLATSCEVLKIATGRIAEFGVISTKSACYPGAAQTVMIVFPRETA